MLQRPLYLVVLLAACLLMPFAVYLGGSILAGPYDGPNGLPGLVLTIYGDALSGHPAALLLLSLPLMLLMIWKLCLWLRKAADTRLASTAQE